MIVCLLNFLGNSGSASEAISENLLGTSGMLGILNAHGYGHDISNNLFEDSHTDNEGESKNSAAIDNIDNRIIDDDEIEISHKDLENMFNDEGKTENDSNVDDNFKNFDELIMDHKECFGTFETFQKFECLPSTRPELCLPPIWNEVKQKFVGKKCPEDSNFGLKPPEYLSVIGHEDCLGTFQPSGSSYYAKCLPLSRPENCIPLAWDKLQEKFDGKKCPENSNFGLQPPKYLSVIGHEDCLGAFQPFSSSYLAKCLPLTRPENCTFLAWRKLQENFDGKTCPENQMIGLPAPEYLSVIGHEDCLILYQPSKTNPIKSKCLPPSRPENCIPPAWEKLQEIFNGELRCPIWSVPDDGISVIGHEDCLNIYQPSPTSPKAKCLPSSRPENCIPPAWEKLQEIFKGDKCPTWSWLTGITDSNTNSDNNAKEGIENIDNEIFAMKSHPLFETKWYDSAHEFYEKLARPPSEKYQNIHQYCLDLAKIMSDQMKKLGYEAESGKFLFPLLCLEFSKLDLCIILSFINFFYRQCS